MPLGHKPWHLSVKESHQKRSNMGPVNVSVTHHYDLTVPTLSRIFFFANTATNSCNNVTNFLITKNAV